jgi:predicted ATPase
MRVPFRSLSDGYRAFIAWVADLLYHVCYGCPSGKKLVESAGVVLVDEVDLHLHPKWQMQVVNTVARALPRMQFVLTSHSPLIASSLEWMNIITLQIRNRTNRTQTGRLKQRIHGLDADQLLLNDFGGLKTTRASGKVSELDELQRRARHGDKAAANRIILAMAQGTEASQ